MYGFVLAQSLFLAYAVGKQETGSGANPFGET